MKIVLDGLKKEIAGRVLVDIPSFEFRDNKRTVLVGPNGCGKSTLFGIMAGLVEADAGRVIVDKSRLALLEQDFPAGLSRGTLFDVCADACSHLARREQELHALEERFSGLDDGARLRYAELREAFERDGGYDWRREVRLVLEGIGFSREEIMKPATSFSGGQKRRALLARALVSEPEVLLLDEPTNHLDLQAIDWLERWLISRKGTTVIISHDRHLIDAVADEIVEFRDAGLERYPVPFAAFREERARRNEARFKQWRQQQEFIEKTEDFIRRNIAGQKTKQAQSRRRLLEKIILLEPPPRDTSWKLTLGKAISEGKIVAEARGLSAGYAEQRVLDAVDLTLYRGEKVAIVGTNGSGKSTLIKAFLGMLQAAEGCVRLGENVTIGYFPQEGGELDPALTVYDEVAKERPTAAEEEIRTLLGAFLFSGDDIYKRISVLSGGEKSRVLLTKLFLRSPNFLIMDEPTNHLDLESRVMLENALADFDGTLLLVSHDRAFVDTIATAVWKIDQGGRIERLDGNIQDNLAQILGTVSSGREAKPETGDSRFTSAPEDGGRKLSRGANRYRIGRIEEEIAELEEKIKIEESKMLSSEALKDGRVYAEIAAECQRLRMELDQRYSAWEEACG